MDAALELTRQKGFDHMTIRDICQKADISIGAFYHYFRNKTDLLKESFYYFDITLDADTMARYDSLTPLLAVKQILTDQTAYTSNEGVHLMTEYYRAILQSEEKGAADPERAYYKSVQHYVAKAVQAGQLPPAYSVTYLTELFIKTVRGSLIDWCLHGGSYDVVKKTSEQFDLIVKGLTT